MTNVEKTENDWQDELTPEQFYILRQKGTERPFTGAYNNFRGEGTFHCSGCGARLFDAATKFDSGSGWPSFFEKITPKAVSEHRDSNHGMERTEVTCTKCGGHLGHVFPDGPRPTGLRYCINSISIIHEDDMEQE